MIERSFVFFWETKSGKFIFESARERKGQLGLNLSGEEICRGRLKEGNKKTFDWNAIKIYVIELTNWIDQNPSMFLQAKDSLRWAENSILRKVLVSKGYNVLLAEGKEKHEGDIHQAIKDLNEYLFGTPTAKDFKPKTRTTKRLLSTIDKIATGEYTDDKLLYGVTMGAGKTSDFVMACQHWHSTFDHNVHLCVTSMPGTRKDLCRDVADGIQFQNVIVCVPDKSLPDVQYILKDRVIGFSEHDQIGSDPTKNYIISLGVHDARGVEGTKYKDFLTKFQFGMYGKDEVHTNQSEYSVFAKHVESYLKYVLALYMTGTPEKFVLEGSEFGDYNSILFLANDLYEAQADGDLDWQGYPWRNICVLDYKTSQDIVVKHLGLEDAHKWTLKKQWAWDKDNAILMHEEVIRELIRIRFGVGVYASDPRCFWGPGSRASKDRKKTICVTIASGDTDKKTKYVAKLIEEETKGTFKGFSAHDTNGYDNWLSYCNNSDGNSVFVTHDKDMTGKNNPWINKQWFSLSIGSSTRAGQHIGRGNRKLIIDGENLKSDVDYFFDDPETALSVILDPIEATTNNVGVTQKNAEAIVRIAAFWFEGNERWMKGAIPDLVKLIQTIDPIGIRGLNSQRHINSNAVCPDVLKGSLAPTKNPASVTAGISDVDGDKGKNSRNTNGEGNDCKNDIDDNKVYKQNLLHSIRSLAKAVIRSEGEFFTVKDILSNPVLEVEQSLVTLEKICKPKILFTDLRSALECGDINEKSINRNLAVIKAKLHEAESSVDNYMVFLNHSDLIDDDTKMVTESVDLVRDYMYNVSQEHPNHNGDQVYGDLCAGRGAYIVEGIKIGLLNPNNAYYNDIDPVNVHTFRRLNKQYSLGIPNEHITCCDALDYKKEYPMIEFDAGVGNPAFNISNKETGNGTGGNVNLYKQISDAYPMKKGGTKALITPKGMIRHLLKDPEFNTTSINLMTERDYWKYNTCWWTGKNEPNQNNIVIRDTVISKVVILTGNPMWYELNGDVNKNKINYTGDDVVDAIIELPTAKHGVIRSKVDPKWEKIAFGPKFCATLFENQTTYMVTDEPLCARFSGAVLTNSIAEAEKIRLFVENSDILTTLNKKLKFKGRVWTMRHLKPFDPNQIVTGKEIPVEWNLAPDDLKVLGL